MNAEKIRQLLFILNDLSIRNCSDRQLTGKKESTVALDNLVNILQLK